MKVSDNIQLVKNYANAWCDKDLDKIMSLITDDCAITNMSIGSFEGAESLQSFFEKVFSSIDKITCNFKNISEGTDGTVLVELMKLMQKGGQVVEIPQMVSFKIRDNKIAGYNSYFDSRKLSELPQLFDLAQANLAETV